MKTKRRSRFNNQSTFDMSSMMDMIFILLIFVMISVSFTKELYKIELDIPSSKIANKLDTLDKPIFIDVYSRERIQMDKIDTSLDTLIQHSKDGYFQKKNVHLNIEKKVPYEVFIQIVDLLKQGNIEKLNLGTNMK